MLPRFLRVDEVGKLTGLCRRSIYTYVAKGLFPAPFRIGIQSVAWRETEVHEWMNSRPRTRKISSSTHKPAHA